MHSTSSLQHIVFDTTWMCPVPKGAKLCCESSTFKVYFMASGNDLTRATTFDTFAQEVLNSIQNKRVHLYSIPA